MDGFNTSLSYWVKRPILRANCQFRRYGIVTYHGELIPCPGEVREIFTFCTAVHLRDSHPLLKKEGGKSPIMDRREKVRKLPSFFVC